MILLLSLNRVSALEAQVFIDEGLAKQYVKASQTLESMLDDCLPYSPLDVLRMPMVAQVGDVDVAMIYPILLWSLADNALKELALHRNREGEELKQTLLSKTR